MSAAKSITHLKWAGCKTGTDLAANIHTAHVTSWEEIQEEPHPKSPKPGKKLKQQPEKDTVEARFYGCLTL